MQVESSWDPPEHWIITLNKGFASGLGIGFGGSALKGVFRAGRFFMFSILGEARIAYHSVVLRMLKQRKNKAFGAMRVFRAQSILGFDQLRSEPLMVGEPSIREPNFATQTRNENERYPDLRFSKIRNGIVCSNRRFSMVLAGSNLLLPPSVDQGPWKLFRGKPEVAGVVAQRENDVLIKVGIPRQAPQGGIFVGTLSPHNWYHWLIDTMPSVHLAANLPSAYSDYPILLPEKVRQKKSWMEPLELLLEGRSIAWIPENGYLQVPDLIWVDSPTSPGPVPQVFEGNAKYRIHGTALLEYRQKLLAGLGLDESKFFPHRKIFMTRKQDGNRPYNQSELARVAERFGFESIDFQGLTLLETATIMLESDHLIGAHGAGWASSIFAKPDRKWAMWTWREELADNWFANIAKLRNADLSVLLTSNKVAKSTHLSPKILEDYLNKVSK